MFAVPLSQLSGLSKGKLQPLLRHPPLLRQTLPDLSFAPIKYFTYFICSMTPRQGYINLALDSVQSPCRLWYRIVGDWPANSRPILTLHGGPGFTHHYLLSTEDLANPPYNRTVIFFDQLGSGNSTHLPEKIGDYKFWTEGLFLRQVNSVLIYLGIETDYDLIGHSWGGMLASAHAAEGPVGLKHLVLANAPVSSNRWLAAYRRYREQMPEPYRKILKTTRTAKSSLDAEYLKAMDVFNKRHFISLDPLPSCVEQSYRALAEDRTVTLST